MTLVSVIVPMFNAAATIGQTLRSAVVQTHADLEIIVVDDGSTDEGPEIVAELATRDARIRLIQTPNGGVAAARNVAIDNAKGALIAPLDADDLWDPRKIELQVARLEDAGEAAVLAYAWFAPIDAAYRILTPPAMPVVEGPAYYRHLDWNFVSNGSSPLVRAEAMRAVRYDPGLRAAGVEGCEDYLMQLQVSRLGEFVCVPACLVGYRKVGGSMGANVARMLKSHMAVMRKATADDDGKAQAIADRRIAEFRVELARHHLRRGRFGEGGSQLLQAAAGDLGAAIRHAVGQVSLLRRRAASMAPNARTFPYDDPFDFTGAPTSPARAKRTGRLALLDAQSALSSSASRRITAEGSHEVGGKAGSSEANASSEVGETNSRSERDR